MTMVSQTEYNARCAIINNTNRVIVSIKDRIREQGIEGIDWNGEASISDSSNCEYCVWNIDVKNQKNSNIATQIINKSPNFEKIICLLVKDSEAKETSIKERYEKIKSYFSIAPNLDIRYILYENAWTPSTIEPSSFTEYICHHVAAGQIPNLQQQTLYPVESDHIAEKVMRLWFDRGHKGQTVTVRGPAVVGSDIETQIINLHPDLAIIPIDPGWGTSEAIGEEITIEGENSAAYVNFVAKHYQQPKTAVIEKPIVQEKVNPAPTPFEYRRFQTVVVEDTPEPSIVPKEVKRYESIAPPVVEQPTITPPVAPTQRINWKITPLLVRLSVGLASVVTIMCGGVIALLVWVSMSSATDSTNLLNQKMNTITVMEVYGKDWGVYPILQKYLTQARINLLKKVATQSLVTSVKYMMTATDGDPYASFQTTRHILDDLYLIQSTSTNAADRPWTIQARRGVDLIPQLIPADKKITVMVLLQNNLELRPTGGFIGAAALLTFDHGKLLSYDTRDIYDLDSNLKGVVNPPEELRTYLGESSWYFRDANWYPDFLDTATTANWFLEKEWGSRADVVVGINLNTIKVLLQTIGSVTLPDGQVINADNLMASAFNYQDAPTGKPENKKTEFISLFLKPLIDQVTTSSTDKVSNIIAAFGQAANQGEVTIIASSPAVVASLVEAGWSGKLPTQQCQSYQTSPCTADFLAVNEANVGINKDNYYVTRSINHSLSLTETAATHQHTIVYTNKAPNDSWPGGTYKAYVRVIVPPQAVNTTISLNGAVVPASNTKQTTTTNYQQIGFMVEIKPLESATISVNYQMPLDPSYQSYSFFTMKQPGASVDPIKITFNPTSGRNFQKVQSNIGELANGSIIGNFDRSILTTIEMAQ
jgi:hypothetical protein